MDGKDIIFIKEMLTKVSDKQIEMEDVIKEMDKTLNALHQTVVGNEAYGQKGLVKEVNDLKSYIDKDKSIKNKIMGGMVLLGFVWSIGIEIFKKMAS